MILLTLYFLFYTGINILPRLQKPYFIAALIFVVCIDVCVSINTNWNITQVKATFYNDYETRLQELTLFR